jgi:hypothetical protein
LPGTPVRNVTTIATCKPNGRPPEGEKPIQDTGVKMNVVRWFTGHFSSRGRALSLYQRGMRKARNHDHEGAIDDYTSVIDTPDASPDVKAMAQYNRALVYLATKNDPKAIEDLSLILAMQEMLVNIKTMARQKLTRIERRSTASRTKWH